MRIRIQQLKLLRSQIRNPGKNNYNSDNTQYNTQYCTVHAEHTCEGRPAGGDLVPALHHEAVHGAGTVPGVYYTCEGRPAGGDLVPTLHHEAVHAAGTVPGVY